MQTARAGTNDKNRPIPGVRGSGIAENEEKPGTTVKNKTFLAFVPGLYDMPVGCMQ